jgi:hypothetical protein
MTEASLEAASLRRQLNSWQPSLFSIFRIPSMAKTTKLSFNYQTVSGIVFTSPVTQSIKSSTFALLAGKDRLRTPTSSKVEATIS